jgi:hypothetical protein
MKREDEHMPESPDRRKRLLEYEAPSLDPFVRADSTTDCSVYWCGVREFPVNSYERIWFLEFLARLARHLKQTQKLREQNFLQNKFLLPDLIELFVKRSEEYVPIIGMTLIPGTEPIKIPDADQMRKEAQKDIDAKRSLDPTRWMPDYAHLFLDTDTTAQRADFFGHGGMLGLYLKPDSRQIEPLPELPRIFTSHPAFSPAMLKQHQMSLAFQDPWLTQSKEVFGEPFKDSASFDGLPFILPLLTSASLLDATADERKRWFELFDGYWIESKPDKGLLLVLKAPDFDLELVELLDQMRLDGYTFRSIL